MARVCDVFLRSCRNRSRERILDEERRSRWCQSDASGKRINRSKGIVKNLDAMAYGPHFVLNCYECGSTVLVPLEGLRQASGSQPCPPDVEPAAVVCDRCKHVRNYNLKNQNPKPSSGVIVSLPEASDWEYLGLLECPEPSCRARLPLFARVSKPVPLEELERDAKAWVWHSLVCPAGHTIPDPQPAMIRVDLPATRSVPANCN